MRILSDRFHLVEDRVLGVVVDQNELFDLLGLAGLLLAELVAREGEHAEEVAVGEDVVQPGQVLQVALGEAAEGGGVDH